MKEKTNRARWLYLAIGTAALLFAGILYGWSILKPPLAAQFGWKPTQLSLNFTFTMCFFCLGGILGGLLMPKLGFRVTCLVSAALSCCGFVTVSMIQSGNVLLLFLGYGLLAGLGIGVAYSAIISTVSAWFPDRKGLCSGVLMMGFGASALVLGKLADAVIQSPAMGWRIAFRGIGIVLGLTVILAGLVIKRPEGKPTSAKAAVSDGKKSFTTEEMLKSPNFYKAMLFLIFLVAVGNTVISVAKDIALSVGVAASAATLLVGVLSVCNGLGRVITGAVFDKKGRRFTMLAANLVTICAACMTLAAVLTHSTVLCVVGLCLTGISYGTCPTICSAFVSEVFGAKHFAMNFPIMNCNLIFASFIATGANLIASATGGYVWPFVMLLGLSAAAMFINLSIREH